MLLIIGFKNGKSTVARGPSEASEAFLVRFGRLCAGGTADDVVQSEALAAD